MSFCLPVQFVILFFSPVNSFLVVLAVLGSRRSRFFPIIVRLEVTMSVFSDGDDGWTDR